TDRRTARQLVAASTTGTGGRSRRWLMVGIVGIAALALVVFGVFWLRRPSARTDGTPPATVAPTVAPTPIVTTIDVPGTQAFVDSRVACKQGNVLDITATGTVQHNVSTPSSSVGPEGSPDAALRQFNVAGLPNANHAALFASLDRKQPFVVVGQSLRFTCPGAGELFLGINDAGVDNNGGKFTATITQR
ncbi:MAG: hypothetical protein WCG47_05975, partial [Dermatophilaceae bacterium]